MEPFDFFKKRKKKLIDNLYGQPLTHIQQNSQQILHLNDSIVNLHDPQQVKNITKDAVKDMSNFYIRIQWKKEYCAIT